MVNVSCYRQSDSGEGLLVAKDGISISDAAQRSQIAREIATGLSIKDNVRFGVYSKHDMLHGWLLPDNKDDFGRYSTTGFLARYGKADHPQDISHALMSNLVLLDVKLSPELKSEFLDAVQAAVTKRRKVRNITLVLAFIVLGLVVLGLILLK